MYASDECIHLRLLARQTAEANEVTANLIVLIVGKQDLSVSHAIVVVGSLLHLAADLGYLVLQSQLGYECLPCCGVNTLGCGFAEVARIRKDTCQHDFRRLIVDGHTQFIEAFKNNGTSRAHHLTTYIRNNGIANIALNVVVNLLQYLRILGTIYALGIVRRSVSIRRVPAATELLSSGRSKPRRLEI